MIEWIEDQAYKLALFNKYTKLYSVFSVQLLEDYHCYQDNTKLIILMSDLKDLQDE